MQSHHFDGYVVDLDEQEEMSVSGAFFLELTFLWRAAPPRLINAIPPLFALAPTLRPSRSAFQGPSRQMFSRLCASQRLHLRLRDLCLCHGTQTAGNMDAKDPWIRRPQSPEREEAQR